MFDEEEREPGAWLRATTPPLVALLLHALAAWLVASLPERWRPPEASRPSPLDEQVFELVATEHTDRPSEPTIARATAPRTSSPVAEREIRASASSQPRRADLASAGAAARDEAAGPPSKEASNDHDRSVEPPWAPSAEPARPIDIGIGIGRNAFLPRSEADVERAEAKRVVERALRDPGRERDRALGLGPEGPVLTALADATWRSVAPVRGRAVFVAVSDAHGEVVSIELLDAEGGRPGWADAARIALASSKGKRLRVGPGTSRVVMKIEVVSAWKLPNGQDPGHDVSLFGARVAKGEGKDSAKTSILDPVPKLRVYDWEPSPGVKIPIPTVELDIFRTNVDPTNLGSKPRRVIHSRLLDSAIM